MSESAITLNISDNLERDIEKQLGTTIMALYRADAPQAWSDIVYDAQARLWKRAVTTHFKSIQPRAYQRTGAIGDAGAVSRQGLIKRPYLDDDRNIVLEVESYITEDGIQEAHAKVQKTIADLDSGGGTHILTRGKNKGSRGGKPTAMGNWAYRIRFPKDGFPLVYPYLANPDPGSIVMPQGGVVGSWHKKDTPYLFDYIFAGPNAPSQPLIYRHLGGSGTRSVGEGLDLLNQYLNLLGLRKIPNLPDSGDKYIEGVPTKDSGKIGSAPIPKFITELGNLLSGFQLNIDMDIDMGDGSLPAAGMAPKPPKPTPRMAPQVKRATPDFRKLQQPSAPAPTPKVHQSIWDSAGAGDLNFSTDID